MDPDARYEIRRQRIRISEWPSAGKESVAETAILQSILQSPSSRHSSNTGLSIGTGVNDTNNLQLDTNALRAALANDINFVRDLLTHPTNGAATRITDLTDEYLRPNGAISRDRNLLNANIDRLDDRLNIFNDRVDSRETLLRNQFNAIAEQLIELGTQTQALGGLGGLGGQLF